MVRIGQNVKGILPAQELEFLFVCSFYESIFIHRASNIKCTLFKH